MLEIDKPIDFWTGRLTRPEARHFVVCLPGGHDAVAKDNPDPLRSTWVATLVLFGPRTVDLDTFSRNMTWKHFTDGSPMPPQVPLEGSYLMYYITAVYVDSDF